MGSQVPYLDPSRHGRTGRHALPRYGVSGGRDTPEAIGARTTATGSSVGIRHPYGHPLSTDAHIEERYQRIDQDTLEVTVTIDDSKAYTETFQ